MTSHKILEAKDDTTLRASLTGDNAKRLRAIAIIGSLVNIFIIFLDGPTRVLLPVNMVRMVWTLAALIYAVLATLATRAARTPAWLKPIFLLAALLSLVFSVLVTAFTPSSAGHTFVLVINILLTATILTLHPKDTLIIYVPAFLALVFSYLWSTGSALHNAGNLINIVAVSLFSLANAWFQWQAAAKAHRFELVIKAQNHRLQELSERDGLTGIANRRRLDHCLELLGSLARRECISLAIIMIDIDDFKSFNDTHGHLAGDEALKAVARTIADSIQRPQDCLGRFGGEEFMVVLAGVDRTGTELVAERIRKSVEALVLPGLPPVTVSLGLTCSILEPGSALLDLVDSADKALFKAKATGKNRSAWS